MEIEEKQQHKEEVKDGISYIHRTNYSPQIVSFTIKDEIIGEHSTNLKKFIVDTIEEGDQFIIQFELNVKKDLVKQRKNIMGPQDNRSCDCRYGVGYWFRSIFSSNKN